MTRVNKKSLESVGEILSDVRLSGMKIDKVLCQVIAEKIYDVSVQAQLEMKDRCVRVAAKNDNMITAEDINNLIPDWN